MNQDKETARIMTQSGFGPTVSWIMEEKSKDKYEDGELYTEVPEGWSAVLAAVKLGEILSLDATAMKVAVSVDYTGDPLRNNLDKCYGYISFTMVGSQPPGMEISGNPGPNTFPTTTSTRTTTTIAAGLSTVPP